MNAWIWTVKRWLNQAGWMGVTGISLLIFSATVYLSTVMPDRARIAELQQKSTSLRHQAELAIARGGISSTNNPESQLQTFYRFFPDPSEKTTGLARIYSAAEHQTLLLETGEYRFLSGQNHALSRYQVTLPVKGSYLQIRNFVNEVLIEVPSAAVDDISFKRENISSPVLNARIKLTLFFGSR